MDGFKEKILSELKWIHEICEENSLRYFIIGGTMLGAVRHKGFIPWDDDADIAMPRDDYEKFYNIVSALNDDRYIIESVKEKNSCLSSPYMRLYDKTTTLVFNLRGYPKRGIFTDIFPLDGCGNDKEQAFKEYKKIHFLKSVVWSKFAAPKADRPIHYKLIIAIYNILPEFIINTKKIFKKLEELAQKHNYDQSEYVANLFGIYKTKEIMPKCLFGRPTLYEFEDTQLYGVEKYDDYLIHLYGDYMTPPPPEKRKTEHDYIECDINKPYLK